MTAAIETRALTKHYGRVVGIENLDLTVQTGEIFGFLGPNGAGKTTTIRTLLGFIRPTGGSATILGFDSVAQGLGIRQHTTYLPGELALYEGLTGHELATYFANLRGGGDQPRDAASIAERLGLDLTRHIKQLSKGNKQKVGLVLAFMDRPELIVLDEPTDGLDPLVQQTFYELVEEVRSDGRTIFISSHNLAEVEHVCDRVAIIRDGLLLNVQPVTELKARALRRLEIDFASPVPAADFAELPGVRDVTVRGTTLRCTVVGSLDAVVKAAARYEVRNVMSEAPSLEEIVIGYYTGTENGAENGQEARDAA